MTAGQMFARGSTDPAVFRFASRLIHAYIASDCSRVMIMEIGTPRAVGSTTYLIKMESHVRVQDTLA